MNGLSRKRTGVSFLKKIDRRFEDSQSGDGSLIDFQIDQK